MTPLNALAAEEAWDLDGTILDATNGAAPDVTHALPPPTRVLQFDSSDGARSKDMPAAYTSEGEKGKEDMYDSQDAEDMGIQCDSETLGTKHACRVRRLSVDKFSCNADGCGLEFHKECLVDVPHVNIDTMTHHSWMCLKKHKKQYLPADKPFELRRASKSKSPAPRTRATKRKSTDLGAGVSVSPMREDKKLDTALLAKTVMSSDIEAKYSMQLLGLMLGGTKITNDNGPTFFKKLAGSNLSTKDKEHFHKLINAGLDADAAYEGDDDGEDGFSEMGYENDTSDAGDSTASAAELDDESDSGSAAGVGRGTNSMDSANEDATDDEAATSTPPPVRPNSSQLPRQAAPNATVQAKIDGDFATIMQQIPSTTEDKCNFDLNHFVRRVITNHWESMTNKSDSPTNKGGSGRVGRNKRATRKEKSIEMIAGGLTQSGKTAFKAIMAIIGKFYGRCTVVVTKGQKERDALHAKIVDMLVGTPVEGHIELVSTPRGSAPRTEDQLQECVQDGGVVVLNSTGSQMQKMCRILRGVRGRFAPDDQGIAAGQFWLVVDEADAIYRTYEQSLVLEQAYLLLTGETTVARRERKLVPNIRIQISATLVPVFLKLKEIGRSVDAANIIYTDPTEDYHGLEKIVPLKDEDDEDVFLVPKELTPGSDFSSEKTNEMYTDAAGKKRSLLLNITCSRVHAANNIYELAQQTQKNHPNVCVIAICAARIEVLKPVVKSKVQPWELQTKGLTISEVLQHLDDDAELGIEVPIFVFGYSRMQRGDSFRSTQRVPTHIIVSLGQSLSIEILIQALGRATFGGKSILEANGFASVTVLTPHNDWDSAQSYLRFQQDLRARIGQGKSLAEVLGQHAEFAWQANFTASTNRTIGPKRARFNLEVGFVAMPPGVERPGQKYSDKQVDRDDVLAAVLGEAKRYVANGEAMPNTIGVGAVTFASVDLHEGLEQMGMTITTVQQNLRALKDSGHLTREKMTAVQKLQYPGLAVAQQWIYRFNL
jgi:hypothetical protein